MPYKITEERREAYRRTSIESGRRKRLALEGTSLKVVHSVNTPRFDPRELMPQLPRNGHSALSLFSGGGGLDLGFDRAGFSHLASYDFLEICGETLKRNRPMWTVLGGAAGDVTGVDWSQYVGAIDVLHGGPPCQPFSVAGRQLGEGDERNMWPAFVAAILSIRPRVFLAENVPGMLDPKFSALVESNIVSQLSDHYRIVRFLVKAEDYGVPQSRKRLIFVGFGYESDYKRFAIPRPTHQLSEELPLQGALCVGVREALGLRDIGFDCIAPTLRSGFTGPRKTTGVVNSKASLDVWSKLEIWPHGVQATRTLASSFPATNGHFRLSTQDCSIIQGFPEDWEFAGAVYQRLGQIGNSVCPPIGYALAKTLLEAMRK